MKTYEEIGKAIAQGFLYIKNKKYYIVDMRRAEVVGKNDECNFVFTVTDKCRNATISAGVNVLKGGWSVNVILSEADRVRLEAIADLGFNYIEVNEDCVRVCKRKDFLECYLMCCFDNLPEGKYIINENCELESMVD